MEGEIPLTRDFDKACVVLSIIVTCVSLTFGRDLL